MAKVLSKEQMEVITQAAVAAMNEYMEKKELQRKKQERDRRLRNTKLLLKHYRSFVAHAETLLARPDDGEWDNTLDDLREQEYAVSAVKRSRERTATMVRFMRDMMGVYRAMCERSPQPEDLRRYRMVEALYIAEEVTTVEQLAEQHAIDTSTVYKDVNNACKVLSVLMFGVDGIRLEL
ncbi:hypothetical protein [Paenibacillus oceani]|uniref:Uncharacterized protein n=1 Tax=Paenibacillus oceani TaxID=2772510 RepID=A0A927C5G3_9BACL|nr:hypothetical protein [Paenibacillus oceani]MBD2861615.1 hypothetical protein [Paenibacillus oceani]